MSNDPDPYRGAFSQSPESTGAHPMPSAPLPSSPPPRPILDEELTAIRPREQWDDMLAQAQAMSRNPAQTMSQSPAQALGHNPAPVAAAPAPVPQQNSSGAQHPGRQALAPAYYANGQQYGAATGGRQDDQRPPQVVLDKTDARRMHEPAERGWRKWLYTCTRINLGPGKDERYEIELKSNVVRTVRSTFSVAVLGLKGGVGKTVSTKSIGSVIAHERGDRVIAVDLDNDSGNLAERHGRETPMSIIDLINDPGVERYLDVRAHTSYDTYSRLEVLGQPEYASTNAVVEQDDFETAIGILRDHYSVVLMDCGTDLKSELVGSVMRQSHALVVVTNASIDALEETDETLKWLRSNGFHTLLENTVLIINHTGPGKPNVVVDRVVEQFSLKVPPHRIFVTRFDRHIHEGRAINLKLVSKKARRTYLQIASALSDMYPRPTDSHAEVTHQSAIEGAALPGSRGHEYLQPHHAHRQPMPRGGTR